MKAKSVKNKSKDYIAESVRIQLIAEKRVKYNNDETLTTPSKVFSFLNLLFPNIQYEIQEHFFAIAMVQGNPVKAIDLHTGGEEKSIVSTSLVCRFALLSGATKIIVAHNHPSGFLEPSNDDIAVTTKLKHALDTIGIPLIDHLLVSDNYYSFQEHGKI